MIKAEGIAHAGRDPRDDPRIVITNLRHRPERLYREIYCARGDSENRLKELHHDLAIGRTSCSRFWANQLRVTLTAPAYVLLQELQWRADRMSLAPAHVGRLRLVLLKIGVRVRRSVRRFVLHLPRAHPDPHAWRPSPPASARSAPDRTLRHSARSTATPDVWLVGHARGRPPVSGRAQAPARQGRHRLGDTTEFVIASSGKLYLAAILDLYSRFIVGWAVSAVNDRHLTLKALQIALKRRCADGIAASLGSGLHAWASEDYQAVLETHGITCEPPRQLRQRGDGEFLCHRQDRGGGALRELRRREDGLV